jgi:hypothetical protein
MSKQDGMVETNGIISDDVRGQADTISTGLRTLADAIDDAIGGDAFDAKYALSFIQRYKGVIGCTVPEPLTKALEAIVSRYAKIGENTLGEI